ncbi:unnamed protein product [Penicillium viridicatum]
MAIYMGPGPQNQQMTPLPFFSDEASALERGRSVARHMRARTDLTGIRTILQWLIDKKVRIDFSGLPGIPKGKLMRLLGRLYQTEQRARPYLSLTLSADEMRDALTADEMKYRPSTKLAACVIYSRILIFAYISLDERLSCPGLHAWIAPSDRQRLIESDQLPWVFEKDVLTCWECLRSRLHPEQHRQQYRATEPSEGPFVRSHFDIEKKEGFSWKRRDHLGTAYGIVISTHSQRIPVTTQGSRHEPGPCAYNKQDGCDRTFSSFTMRRDMQKSIITSLNGYTNILSANPTCKVDVRHKLAPCQNLKPYGIEISIDVVR